MSKILDVENKMYDMMCDISDIIMLYEIGKVQYECCFMR